MGNGEWGMGNGSLGHRSLLEFKLNLQRFPRERFTRESWLGLTNSQFPIPNSQKAFIF